MKRILLIAAVTAVALMGFTFWQKGSHAGAHGAEEENEEGMDFSDIPLTQQQINTVDLRMGEVEPRQLDATIQVNGSLVLRPQDKGDVASLMGGTVKSVLVKEGQQVRCGQVVATVENTDIVSLQREYYSAYKECEMAKVEMMRQQTLASNGAGIKRNLQQTQKEYQVAKANLTGIARQLAIGHQSGYGGKGLFLHRFPAPCTHRWHCEPGGRQRGRLCRHADSFDENTQQQGGRVRPQRLRERYS